MHKAQELHKACFIMDMHNDLPQHLLKRRRAGERAVMRQQYLPDMRAGNVGGIVCAIFLSNTEADDWTAAAFAQVEAVRADIAETSDEFMLCTTLADIETARQNGRIALMLSLEGCEPLDSLDTLHKFHALGVRFIGLTWKRTNALAEGCTFTSLDIPEEPRKGLSSFGKNIVDEANRLGMVVDVSHISERGFWDTLKRTSGRVFASHTNTQAVNPVRRNFSDEQIKALAERNSLTGINGVGAHVRQSGEDLVSGFADHIDYVRSLVGSAHVGIGLDLFFYYNPDRPGISPDTFAGYRELSALTGELMRRGYTDSEIANILGGNFLRFLGDSGF